MTDLTPPPPSYGPGSVLAGKYRLEHKLGQGAMAEVWAARNTTLDLPVALKLIRRRSRQPELIDRLLREAQAVAKLTHPAAVRVFDFGATDWGDPYIVMERLEGRDLRQLLEERGPLSPEDAVAVMLPVAAAVHAAHAVGIVHRDLKPDNVFLAKDRDKLQPKVLDFGVAKLEWDGDPDAGQVVGTPEYMAPEQALGAPDADHRLDVWGFCAVLYELIAGESPFRSNGALDAMRAALQDEVPSLYDAGRTDERLWIIIERGLRKEPADRWSSLDELGERLASWLASRGVNEDVTGASLPAGWGVTTAAPPPMADDYGRGSGDSAFGIDSRPLPPPGRRARAIGAAVVGVGSVALAIAWMSLPDGSPAETTDTTSAAASSRVAQVAAQSAAPAASSAPTPPPPAETASAAPPATAAATTAPTTSARTKTAAAPPRAPAPRPAAPQRKPSRPKGAAADPAGEDPNPAALPLSEAPPEAPPEAAPAAPEPPAALPPAAPPPAAPEPPAAAPPAEASE
jgi:serine/threonine-protein kinase